ncbi:MAG: hypothetical protein QM702_03425 [Rubrivivax sp.]
MRRGLIRTVDATEPAYRFGTSPAELATVVDRLARLYAGRRVSIIALIYSKPTDTLRTFADAFRFRKDGRDG